MPFANTASISPTCACLPSPTWAIVLRRQIWKQLAINKDLPVIAIRIPHVGELSRKERDDIKPLFVSKGGARVFEDFKRIETKFPEAGAKVRAMRKRARRQRTICWCW